MPIHPTPQTIQIHPAAPQKPGWGDACNGCGVCCAAEPCPVGVLVSGRTRGACRALHWSDEQQRYRCALMAVPLLGRVAARFISAGKGCDSDAEVVD